MEEIFESFQGLTVKI